MVLPGEPAVADAPPSAPMPPGPPAPPPPPPPATITWVPPTTTSEYPPPPAPAAPSPSPPGPPPPVPPAPTAESSPPSPPTPPTSIWTEEPELTAEGRHHLPAESACSSGEAGVGVHRCRPGHRPRRSLPCRRRWAPSRSSCRPWRRWPWWMPPRPPPRPAPPQRRQRRPTQRRSPHRSEAAAILGAHHPYQIASARNRPPRPLWPRDVTEAGDTGGGSWAPHDRTSV